MITFLICITGYITILAYSDKYNIKKLVLIHVLLYFSLYSSSVRLALLKWTSNLCQLGRAPELSESCCSLPPRGWSMEQHLLALKPGENAREKNRNISPEFCKCKQNEMFSLDLLWSDLTVSLLDARCHVFAAFSCCGSTAVVGLWDLIALQVTDAEFRGNKPLRRNYPCIHTVVQFFLLSSNKKFKAQYLL